MRLLSLLCVPLVLLAHPSAEELAKRIYDHLLIRDNLSAVTEGKQAISLYPSSQALIMAHFRALCQQGEELEAIKYWEKLEPTIQYERPTLEALAWGVLNKAKHSDQLEIRMNVLMASAFTGDVKALPYLVEEMRSSNALLRSMAIRLSAQFGDAPLKRELERLLREEKLWHVRLEAIQTIGRLQMKHLQPVLKEMLLSPKATLEEKGILQIALVSMYEDLSREELLLLVKSDRALLRQLACEIVSYLELTSLTPDLYPLLRDTSSDVRIAAINTLTLLRDAPSFEMIKELLEDPAFDVAITAGWSAMIFDSKVGEAKLAEWLKDPNAEHRRMAAGALAISGPRGIKLAAKVMKETADMYVKATLAASLIGQRKHVRMAQKVLYNLLMSDQRTEWMWDSQHNLLFRSLAPSRVKHRDGVPQYPKVVDQMVRLELLTLLCMTHHAQAEEAVRGFLKSHNWGVTGAAASILLGEGNETSIDISQKLLEDPDEKVRLQAAFILAITGSNEAALPILKEAYSKLDRGMKLHVLEAIAQIGERESIPFLIAQLKEPFQVLRVAAAAALIRCLYH